MSDAFSQALVKGLDASSVRSQSGMTSSSSTIGPHLVLQTHGDPNYYATAPKFDSSGYWYSAGSFPPYGPPKGDPVTPSQGEWVQHGTTMRNGQTTSFWVWYPPKDKSVNFGSHESGHHNYLVGRTKPTNSAKQLFPNYWVHEYVVPTPSPSPKSSYKPQSLGYDTVENIVPVVGTFHCNKWLLVATQYGALNATVSGGLFNAAKVFKYYMEFVGVSPYFTWNGYLFKFHYTGYDAKTGKYRHGSQYKNIIIICTDGLNVQKNPHGSSSTYTVYPPGGSGGVLVVHTGTGRIPEKESSMEAAFSSRGLGRAHRASDSAFSHALLRGLGQLSEFSAGGNGTATLTAIDPSNVPLVNSPNWAEFYPNDPFGFRANTNLALNTSDQATGSAPVGAFHDANPIGGAIVSQVSASTPGATAVWNLWDPNNRAAYTIGMGGNTSGDGSYAGVALIRSSWPSGNLKLEIATKIAAKSPSNLPGWPSKATQVNATSLPLTTLSWAQLYGPVGGNLTGTLWPGHKISLGGTDLNNILNNYLAYISQPQFLEGIPSAAWGQWYGGFGVGTPISVPDIYFMYGGQLYRVFWSGTWNPGQVGGSPNSGPAVSVCTNFLSLKPPLTPPPPPPAPPPPVSSAPYSGGLPLTPPPVLSASSPGGLFPPSALPPVPSPPSAPGGLPAPSPLFPIRRRAPSAPISTVPTQAMPVTTVTQTPGIPPGVAIAVGLIGAGILGGVLYLVFE